MLIGDPIPHLPPLMHEKKIFHSRQQQYPNDQMDTSSLIQPTSPGSGITLSMGRNSSTTEACTIDLKRSTVTVTVVYGASTFGSTEVECTATTPHNTACTCLVGDAPVPVAMFSQVKLKSGVQVVAQESDPAYCWHEHFRGAAELDDPLLIPSQLGIADPKDELDNVAPSANTLAASLLPASPTAYTPAGNVVGGLTVDDTTHAVTYATTGTFTGIPSTVDFSKKSNWDQNKSIIIPKAGCTKTYTIPLMYFLQMWYAPETLERGLTEFPVGDFKLEFDVAALASWLVVRSADSAAALPTVTVSSMVLNAWIWHYDIATCSAVFNASFPHVLPYVTSYHQIQKRTVVFPATANTSVTLDSPVTNMPQIVVVKIVRDGEHGLRGTSQYVNGITSVELSGRRKYQEQYDTIKAATPQHFAADECDPMAVQRYKCWAALRPLKDAGVSDYTSFLNYDNCWVVGIAPEMEEAPTSYAEITPLCDDYQDTQMLRVTLSKSASPSDAGTCYFTCHYNSRIAIIDGQISSEHTRVV